MSEPAAWLQALAATDAMGDVFPDSGCGDRACDFCASKPEAVFAVPEVTSGAAFAAMGGER